MTKSKNNPPMTVNIRPYLEAFENYKRGSFERHTLEDIDAIRIAIRNGKKIILPHSKGGGNVLYFFGSFFFAFFLFGFVFIIGIIPPSHLSIPGIILFWVLMGGIFSPVFIAGTYFRLDRYVILGPEGVLVKKIRHPQKMYKWNNLVLHSYEYAYQGRYGYHYTSITKLTTPDLEQIDLDPMDYKNIEFSKVYKKEFIKPSLQARLFAFSIEEYYNRYSNIKDVETRRRDLPWRSNIERDKTLAPKAFIALGITLFIGGIMIAISAMSFGLLPAFFGFLPFAIMAGLLFLLASKYLVTYLTITEKGIYIRRHRNHFKTEFHPFDEIIQIKVGGREWKPGMKPFNYDNLGLYFKNDIPYNISKTWVEDIKYVLKILPPRLNLKYQEETCYLCKVERSGFRCEKCGRITCYDCHYSKRCDVCRLKRFYVREAIGLGLAAFFMLVLLLHFSFPPIYADERSTSIARTGAILTYQITSIGVSFFITSYGLGVFIADYNLPSGISRHKNTSNFSYVADSLVGFITFLKVVYYIHMVTLGSAALILVDLIGLPISIYIVNWYYREMF